MPQQLVRSSWRYAREHFHEGGDPLKILWPWEVKAAEVFLQVSSTIEMTNSRGTPYADDFHEHLFQAIPTLPRSAGYFAMLRKNPAWRAYVQSLKEHARDHALSTLHEKAGRAVDNYLWSQESARSAGDYKETRIASADHLDRIGATEKPPTSVVQVAAITLRSRNFTEANLLEASPEFEGEAVEEKKDAEV